MREHFESVRARFPAKSGDERSGPVSSVAPCIQKADRQAFANLFTEVSVLVVIAHLRSDALQPIFKIFRGPPPNAPGRKATRTKHCGLTRLSQLKNNLAF